MYVQGELHWLPMPTQSDRRAATTASLLSAARKLFATEGYTTVSIDDIASAAGVTRGALYHHFPSKTAVFERVVHDTQAELREEVVGAVASIEHPREQLLAGFQEFIGLCARPDRQQIMLVDGPAILGWQRYRDIDEEYFYELVLASIAAILPDDPGQVHAMTAHALLAASCELAMRFGAGATEEHVRDVLERLIPTSAP